MNYIYADVFMTMDPSAEGGSVRMSHGMMLGAAALMETAMVMVPLFSLPKVSCKSLGKYRGWTDAHYGCHPVSFCWGCDASFVLSTLCKCRSYKYLIHRLLCMEVAQR